MYEIETRSFVRELLSSPVLLDNESNALYYYYFEDYDFKEIGALLYMSESGAWFLVNKGLKKLKEWSVRDGFRNKRFKGHSMKNLKKDQSNERLKNKTY